MFFSKKTPFLLLNHWERSVLSGLKPLPSYWLNPWCIISSEKRCSSSSPDEMPRADWRLHMFSCRLPKMCFKPQSGATLNQANFPRNLTGSWCLRMNCATKWPIGTKFIWLVFERIMSHCFTLHWFCWSYHCKYRNGRFPWCKCDNNFTPVYQYTSSTNHLHLHIQQLVAGPILVEIHFEHSFRP